MNDYNEIRAHLAHFGITGQKKGLRRFQFYAVAPTQSGMVGQEVGEAAKQRGRLGKKVKDAAKKTVKNIKYGYKHPMVGNKIKTARKSATEAATVGVKGASLIDKINKHVDKGDYSLKNKPVMYMFQKRQQYIDRVKPKNSNNFRPIHENVLMDNVNKLKKPAKAVAKVGAKVVGEVHNTRKDVQKFTPENVKTGRVGFNDSFIVQGYKRGQKHRRKKK